MKVKFLLTVLLLICFLGCVSSPEKKDTKTTTTLPSTSGPSGPAGPASAATTTTINPWPEKISPECQGQLVLSSDKIWLYTGERVNLLAVFKNVGYTSFPVVFKGKATLDNSIEGIFESEEIESHSGETINLTTTFTPLKPGRYTISGKVYFCDKTSNEKSTILNVRDIKEKPISQTFPQ